MPIAPASPQPFTPKRIVRAGRLTGMIDLVERHIIGPRHGVIHVGPGQQLTVLVIGAVLQQRLSNALSQPAMHLATDNHRVDDIAKIICSREPLDA